MRGRATFEGPAPRATIRRLTASRLTASRLNAFLIDFHLHALIEGPHTGDAGDVAEQLRALYRTCEYALSGRKCSTNLKHRHL